MLNNDTAHKPCTLWRRCQLCFVAATLSKYKNCYSVANVCPTTDSVNFNGEMGCQMGICTHHSVNKLCDFQSSLVHFNYLDYWIHKLVMVYRIICNTKQYFELWKQCNSIVMAKPSGPSRQSYINNDTLYLIHSKSMH